MIQKPPRGRKTEEEYYIVPVYRDTIDEEQMAERIVNACSLTRGDVVAAISALKEEMASALAQGSKVHIKGIGTFRLRLTTPKKDLQSTDKVAKDITVRDVAFRPDSDFTRRFANVSFTRTDHSHTLRRVADADTLLASLRTYFASHTHLRRANLQQLAQCSRSKACQLLRDLVTAGYLVNEGDRHAPFYCATEQLAEDT